MGSTAALNSDSTRPMRRVVWSEPKPSCANGSVGSMRSAGRPETSAARLTSRLSRPGSGRSRGLPRSTVRRGAPTAVASAADGVTAASRFGDRRHSPTTTRRPSCQARRVTARWTLPLLVSGSVPLRTSTTASSSTSSSSATACRMRATTSSTSRPPSRRTSCTSTMASRPFASIPNAAPRPSDRCGSAPHALASISCG